jgi:ribosomal protein S18 acetylase RimI-like enzyme
MMLRARASSEARTTVDIEAVTAVGAGALQPTLVSILQDSVDSGASVGFLPPLHEAEAAAYWDTVAAAVSDGTRVLLVARSGGEVVGTAQLDLATRANARHRAEVMKVMVHRQARRRGVGRHLMLALEAHARRLGRTTLVLDTRQGDPSERLYREVGWCFAGAIPSYARSAGGQLDASAFYYRLLDGEETT